MRNRWFASIILLRAETLYLYGKLNAWRPFLYLAYENVKNCFIPGGYRIVQCSLRKKAFIACRFLLIMDHIRGYLVLLCFFARQMILSRIFCFLINPPADEIVSCCEPAALPESADENLLISFKLMVHGILSESLTAFFVGSAVVSIGPADRVIIKSLTRNVMFQTADACPRRLA